MGKIHQFFTTLAASYGMFLYGILFVWPSYTVPLYTNKNTTLLSAPLTRAGVSLLSSLPALGALLGTFLTGKIINFLGRKKGGLMLILPFLLSWIMVDLTSYSLVIMIARFVGGFSGGAFLVYGPIFISEVAEISIRGFLASVPIVLYCLGLLISYIFGWFLTYRYILWINMGLSCIGIVILMMVTESPTWLVRQKREADAHLAFAYYRGVSPVSMIVLEEILRLKAQIIPAVELTTISGRHCTTQEAEKEKINVEEEITIQKKRLSPIKLIFVSPSSRRAFVVTGLTLAMQVMMGLIVVQVYAKEIFSNAIPSISPHLCSVMLAATIFVGTITSAALSDRFGRRILLTISASTVALCLICMGVLQQTNVLPPWAMAVLVIIYCYAFKFGAGNVPYVLLAEVFIPEVQTTAAIILIEGLWLLSFVQLGTYPYIVKFFGIHGAFYYFSVFAAFNTLLSIYFLPETKGLSNEQIQEAFLKKRKT